MVISDTFGTNLMPHNHLFLTHPTLHFSLLFSSPEQKAYRHDLPDPRYTNPMLPQWTKLMKDITVNRIKRKRTRELGMQLTQLRSFKRWKRLMTVDRTKPVTPLAVAIMHYSTVLMTKVLHLWHGVIRERGKMMRFRTKIFQSWRKWAPKHKQMRIFNGKAQELIRLKLVQRAYGVMIKLCFNVIGTRTERIKELRRNFCDRRVVICAYALLHKVSDMLLFTWVCMVAECSYHNVWGLLSVCSRLVCSV